MEDLEKLVQTTLGEIEKALSTKTVVGEPIAVEGATLVPLVAAGFGFGVASGKGGCKGKSESGGEGAGGASGGGAGIRPVALVIVDKTGVRVEPIRSGLAAAMDRMAGVVPETIEKLLGKKKEGKEQG